MKITAIKAQIKDENRVSIFLDGKYSFSLSLDQLLEQKLKKNIELDENEVKNLKKLSDEGKMKAKATEWLLGRPHSTREFRDYLYRKKAEKDLIEAWVEEFSSKNYLNDEQYARWFAENRRRKNKSSRAITAELYSKGVPQATVQKIIAEVEQEGSADSKSEKEALTEIVNKMKQRSRYQDEKKLIAYLLSKGFSYGLIKETLAEDY